MNVSPLDMKVLRVVTTRTIDDPITGDEIGGILGCEWRQVAKSVEMLRFYGFKIGSSKRKPMGYFLARSPHEIKETSDRIKQQCLVQLAQLKKLNTWNEKEPTIFEGAELEEIDDAIAQFQQCTGEILV